ncbi:unnamed protein product [Menidia menidia]|uniref:(Atlantic silverside) hypothetical protein n=1 Tax=Menidia menidia TaxID=238744 RepID=A0A8S4C213_9TELE|nr:unnamed protein product [Menidia menidia]
MTMGTHWCAISLLVLSFGIFVHSLFKFHDGHTKPGQCPSSLRGFPSGVGCECDGDCPDNHKCCEYHCGNFCLPPVFVRAECPDNHWSVGTCVNSCSDDHHCPHGKKCCFNGCGHECTVPKIVKPGSCGFPSLTCEKLCSDDSNCDGNEKCCSAFCGLACREPL